MPALFARNSYAALSRLVASLWRTLTSNLAGLFVFDYYIMHGQYLVLRSAT